MGLVTACFWWHAHFMAEAMAAGVARDCPGSVLVVLWNTGEGTPAALRRRAGRWPGSGHPHRLAPLGPGRADLPGPGCHRLEKSWRLYAKNLAAGRPGRPGWAWRCLWPVFSRLNAINSPTSFLNCRRPADRLVGHDHAAVSSRPSSPGLP